MRILLPEEVALRRATRQKAYYEKHKAAILRANEARRKKDTARVNETARIRFHTRQLKSKMVAEQEYNRSRQRKSRGLPLPTRPCPSVCEICANPPGKIAMHLDHNHSTGAFRGWLCGNCNRALGFLKDSSDLCVAAARYLRTSELL
jgi:hypothetical protein